MGPAGPSDLTQAWQVTGGNTIVGTLQRSNKIVVGSTP